MGIHSLINVKYDAVVPIVTALYHYLFFRVKMKSDDHM